MKLLLFYLKSRRRELMAFAFLCGIFCVAFALYRVPIGAVLYPALVCGLFGAGLLAVDFLDLWKRRRRYRELLSLPGELLWPLPEARTPEEEAALELVARLVQEERELRGEMEGRFSDMVEYYTTWVHQIKTPIAAMRLILQNEDSETARKLSEELFRVEQYVEMVLCYLRLDSDSTDYVIAPYRLDGIVRQAIRRFAASFIGRNLRLVYEPVEETVVTDEKWLLFVLEQIFSNALKYTPSGSISVCWEAPATLCIRDTGIGIAPEDLPRICERGYTGCNGRSDKKASGIGLYLCKRICGKLSHGLQISSVPGEGTEVRITFEKPLGRE